MAREWALLVDALRAFPQHSAHLAQHLAAAYYLQELVDPAAAESAVEPEWFKQHMRNSLQPSASDPASASALSVDLPAISLVCLSLSRTPTVSCF